MTLFDGALLGALIGLGGYQLVLLMRRPRAIRLLVPAECPASPVETREEGREIEPLVAPYRQPALFLKKSADPGPSYLGGMPWDHPDLVWPRRKGHPLSFLACLDLEQMKSGIDWLPRTGLLYFFYDLKDQPWGYDPSHGDGFAVIYLGDRSRLKDNQARPDGWLAENELPQKYLVAEKVLIPPPSCSGDLEKLALSEVEKEDLFELRLSLYGEGPHHQLGGFANAVHGDDMDEECAVVTHGVNCGGIKEYDEIRAQEFAPEAKEWKLLFQMDSDHEMDMMWGDSGMIYFWVKAEEARRGNFKNAWVILQCC